MADRELFRLYAITDEECLVNTTLYDAVDTAIKGGITCLQYRNKSIGKDMSGVTNEVLEDIWKLRNLCKNNNIPFIVNDNIPLALVVEADGVHIGQEDMTVIEVRKILGSDAIIGVTAKTKSQAIEAYEGSANYLGSGAIFGTTTKMNARKMDMDTLKEICKSVPIPVVAIGGINCQNAAKLIGTGIAGLAVINGIFGEKDVEEACVQLRRIAQEL